VDEGQARSCLQRRNCAWQVENYWCVTAFAEK
jgi:hypothetical protein